MTYKTKGTCSSMIDFEIENGILKDVRFTGGCNGNLQGISALVKGMPVDEVIKSSKVLTVAAKEQAAPISLPTHSYKPPKMTPCRYRAAE